jgi:hypothetical protein
MFALEGCFRVNFCSQRPKSGLLTVNFRTVAAGTPISGSAPFAISSAAKQLAHGPEIDVCSRSCFFGWWRVILRCAKTSPLLGINSPTNHRRCAIRGGSTRYRRLLLSWGIMKGAELGIHEIEHHGIVSCTSRGSFEQSLLDPRDVALPAVLLASRGRTPMATSLRPGDQSRRPKANTGCFLFALKTLVMPREGTNLSSGSQCPGPRFPCMAGFLVTINRRLGSSLRRNAIAFTNLG